MATGSLGNRTNQLQASPMPSAPSSRKTMTGQTSAFVNTDEPPGLVLPMVGLKWLTQ